jgi:hypothetical protein
VFASSFLQGVYSLTLQLDKHTHTTEMIIGLQIMGQNLNPLMLLLDSANAFADGR